jgi:hypothetical protein
MASGGVGGTGQPGDLPSPFFVDPETGVQF